MPVMSGLFECSLKESGHLRSSNQIVGAEHIVGRRVAPFCDSGCSELVDGRFEDVTVVVDEQIAASIIGG